MRVSAIIAMVIGLSLISTATANPKAEKMIGKINFILTVRKRKVILPSVFYLLLEL